MPDELVVAQSERGIALLRIEGCRLVVGCEGTAWQNCSKKAEHAHTRSAEPVIGQTHDETTSVPEGYVHCSTKRIGSPLR